MHQDSTPAADPATPPKATPEAVALRAAPRPVTRLNRRTLIVGLALLMAVVFAATMWSLRRVAPRDKDTSPQAHNVERVSRSDALAKLPADYSQLPATAVPALGPPLPGDLGPMIVQPSTPAVPSYAPPGHDAASTSAAQDAQRQLAESAATAPVFFSTAASPRAASPPTGEGTATPVPGPSLSLLAPGTGAAPPGAIDPGVAQNQQAQKESFLKSGSAGALNSSDLREPVSPYMVMADRTIPAALARGIISDLPGDLVATVTQPIYDQATGRHLLIPQGSTVLGRYNSQVSFGQRRVQVVWHRIILPDTSSILLDNFVGTDAAGYAGLEDGVDWHWDRLFAGAALTTLLGVGAELAAPENRQGGDRVVLAGRDSVQEAISQAGQEMTRRNMNLQPTLTIRPGFPVNISVNRDLVLRPYQPMFFTRGVPR